ncbi:MAG: hypothetical protein FWD06_10995 [Oscillospiraceae bacterium]|nr:hypothetical protein [Oscillospiraceae bacterium]
MQYLYPQNLKSEANMWLWSMRDFTVVAMCVLLAVLVLATTRSAIPLAVAAVYGFLTIRFEEVYILDFISWATRYFITTQQEFRWRCHAKKE